MTLTFRNRKIDTPKSYDRPKMFLYIAQKTKIKTAQDLEKIIKDVLKSNQKTILLAIYNNQNQRRYIGVKLD